MSDHAPADTANETTTHAEANRPLSEAEQAERGTMVAAFQRWGLLIGNATSIAEMRAAFQLMDTELPAELAKCPELAKIQ